MTKYMTSRKQEAERYLELMKRSGTYTKHIAHNFDILQTRIENEINAFYSKYASTEGITMAEAKKRASSYDIESHKKRVKELLASKKLTPNAEKELRLYNLSLKVTRLELLQENIRLEMIQEFSDVEQYTKDKLLTDSVEEFNRMEMLLGGTAFLKDNSTIMKAVVEGSWHNASFSDRLWSNQDVLRYQLGQLLSAGIISGKNPRELARQLRKSVDSSRANAERLLRTEYAHIQVEAERMVYEKEDVEYFEFIANGRTACPICKALDGKVFKVKDLEIGENAPPMHPNCMCATAPIVPEPERD